jgi:maltoporin
MWIIVLSCYNYGQRNTINNFLIGIKVKFAAFFLVSLICFQSFAMPVDVHGYLRSGVGNNLQGGKQNCFNNPGSGGNEFRLGNECNVYGETTFSLEFLQKNETNSSFKAHTTLAFFPNGNTQYGDESNLNDVDIVEAFAESKKLEDAPYTFWVGKRFYRDVDIHMDDFYYFAAMSGVGAGINDVPLFNGSFAAAYLQETMTSSTSSDQLVKSYFDFRLFGVQVYNLGELNFWSTFATAPKGKIDTTQYEKIDGESLGIRLRNNFSDGFNDFALLYGRNLMSALSVYGNGQISNNTINDHRYTARMVESLTKRATDKFELHASSVVEVRNNGREHSTWWDVGFRPVYFIKDHLHFVTEIGHSEVISHSSTLILSRLTFAYEIALNKSIWARPVLRAFATETFWNKENRINFSGRKGGRSLGAQMEAWF